MGIELLPSVIRTNYSVLEWKHACAVLKADFPKEFKDVIDVFTEFRLRKSWITVGGGRKITCL